MRARTAVVLRSLRKIPPLSIPRPPRNTPVLDTERGFRVLERPPVARGPRRARRVEASASSARRRLVVSATLAEEVGKRLRPLRVLPRTNAYRRNGPLFPGEALARARARAAPTEVAVIEHEPALALSALTSLRGVREALGALVSATLGRLVFRPSRLAERGLSTLRPAPHGSWYRKHASLTDEPHTEREDEKRLTCSMRRPHVRPFPSGPELRLGLFERTRGMRSRSRACVTRSKGAAEDCRYRASELGRQAGRLRATRGPISSDSVARAESLSPRANRRGRRKVRG
jgi:hypothetical protein